MATEESTVIDAESVTIQASSDDQALAVSKKGTLPESLTRRGINAEQWNTLTRSLFPGAHPASVALVWDYCKARGLDPMKKPCHIVPMRVKDSKTGNWEWRDVVMPGIYEYRITAQRTKTYLGHSKPEYGPMVVFAGVNAPEWCSITFYRKAGTERVEFPVTVFFREVVGLKGDTANDRWKRAPIQMLTKCTEAAGLREAWPEEFGGEPIVEEMAGQPALDEPVHAAPVSAQDANDEALAQFTVEEQASIRDLINTAKLNKGQTTALFMKHKTNAAAILAELTDMLAVTGKDPKGRELSADDATAELSKVVEHVKQRIATPKKAEPAKVSAPHESDISF